MKKEWYFVSKLQPNERHESGERFEVQVLDSHGEAMSVGYIDEDTSELVINGRKIPSPVIEAAKRSVEGQGDYIGSDGNSLPPF